MGESVSKPLLYYENNIGGTTTLLSLLSKVICWAVDFHHFYRLYMPPSVSYCPARSTALVSLLSSPTSIPHPKPSR